MNAFLSPEDKALYSGITGNLLSEDNIKAAYEYAFDHAAPEGMSKEDMAAKIESQWSEEGI